MNVLWSEVRLALEVEDDRSTKPLREPPNTNLDPGRRRRKGEREHHARGEGRGVEDVHLVHHTAVIGSDGRNDPGLLPGCLDKELESGDPLAGDRCLLKAFPGWTMTNWASFAMVGAGAVMLAYGSSYKKRKAARITNLQVSPYVSSTYTGIGLAGQF